MRQARLKPDYRDTWHHCYNRVVGTCEDRPLGDAEKEQLVRILRRVADFYAVRIVPPPFLRPCPSVPVPQGRALGTGTAWQQALRGGNASPRRHRDTLSAATPDPSGCELSNGWTICCGAVSCDADGFRRRFSVPLPSLSTYRPCPSTVLQPPAA